MRKVTRHAVDAFINRQPFKKSNTHVRVLDNVTILFLFGHPIAEKVGKRLYISACGYLTNTTKERLNALPGVNIQQKDRKWYLNGKEWDGARILVKP